MSDPAERLKVTAKDGHQLAMIRSGPADGLAVLVHFGTPNGLVALPPMLAEAFSGVRTVLYARPGYAGSTRQPGRTVADGPPTAAASWTR